MEKTSLLRVGMVVLRSMSRVNTPPRVSMPSESGVTSRSSRSLTSPDEHAGLDGRADRHHLVRVDALVRLLAEELLHQLLDLRDARAAADQHDLVDLVRARRPASFRHWRTGPIDRSQQVVHELLELRAA